MGYLYSSPDDDYKPPTNNARINAYTMQGITPEYPNIKGYEYLVQHLQNLGFGTSEMNGFVPLTFQEINAYMQCTSTPLTPDEVLILKDMSNEYCKFINDKNPATQSPPYKDDTKSN